jgi:hypothetical protein
VLSSEIRAQVSGRLVARGARHLVPRVLIVPAVLAWLAAGPFAAYAQVPAALNAQAPATVNVLIKSQYRRLTFNQEIQRIAVGDTEILSAEVISSRELLLLGRETGRTTLIVWFTNGTSNEYRFSVERDLSLLDRALKSIDPSIEVESAPDRDALVLTGTVRDITASMAAEAIARNYLDAGSTRQGGAQPLVASPAAPPPGGARERTTAGNHPFDGHGHQPDSAADAAAASRAENRGSDPVDRRTERHDSPSASRQRP